MLPNGFRSYRHAAPPHSTAVKPVRAGASSVWESARKLAESFGLFIQAGRLFTEAARDVLKAPEAEKHKPVWENPFAMLSDVAKASKR